MAEHHEHVQSVGGSQHNARASREVNDKEGTPCEQSHSPGQPIEQTDSTAGSASDAESTAKECELAGTARKPGLIPAVAVQDGGELLATKEATGATRAKQSVAPAPVPITTWGSKGIVGHDTADKFERPNGQPDDGNDAPSPETLAAASVIEMLAVNAGRRKLPVNASEGIMRSPSYVPRLAEGSPTTTVAGSPIPALTPLPAVAASAAASNRMVVTTGVATRAVTGGGFVLPSPAGTKGSYDMNRTEPRKDIAPSAGHDQHPSAMPRPEMPQPETTPFVRHHGQPIRRHPRPSFAHVSREGTIRYPYPGQDGAVAGSNPGSRNVLDTALPGVTPQFLDSARAGAVGVEANVTLRDCIAEIRTLAAEVTNLKGQVADLTRQIPPQDSSLTSCVIHVRKDGNVSVRTPKMHSVVGIERDDVVLQSNLGGLDGGDCGHVASEEGEGTWIAGSVNGNVSPAGWNHVDLGVGPANGKRSRGRRFGRQDDGAHEGQDPIVPGRVSRSASGERHVPRNESSFRNMFTRKPKSVGLHASVENVVPTTRMSPKPSAATQPRNGYVGGSSAGEPRSQLAHVGPEEKECEPRRLCESSPAASTEGVRASAPIRSFVAAKGACASYQHAQLEGSPLMSLALAAHLPGVGVPPGGMNSQPAQRASKGITPRKESDEVVAPPWYASRGHRPIAPKPYDREGGELHAEPARYVFPRASPFIPVRSQRRPEKNTKTNWGHAAPHRSQPPAALGQGAGVTRGLEARMQAVAQAGKRHSSLGQNERKASATCEEGESVPVHARHDVIHGAPVPPIVTGGVAGESLDDDSASTATMSDEDEDDAFDEERLKCRGTKRLEGGRNGDAGSDRDGRPPRKKRVRDNWTPEEDKVFFDIVEENRSLTDVDVVRILAARLGPRRTYQQVKGHLKNMRAAAKI